MIISPFSFLTRPIFPELCFHCKTLLGPNKQSLCQGCIAALPKLSRLDDTKLQKIGASIKSDFKASLFFNEPVETLCYSLKYGGNFRLARTLGEHVMGPDLVRRLQKSMQHTAPFVLVPMPVHFRRRLKRGYNQSEELAKGVLIALQQSGYSGELLPLLEKTTHLKSQVNFGPFERWSNTASAFVVNERQKKRVPGDAFLLLIDDTVTTGSSMLRAGECLKEAFGKNRLLLHALALEI